MLAYYVLGVLLGAGSSVVPGPCGLAVIDAATRPRAVATAVGSGLGDLAYGALGVFGVGHLLAGDPELVAIMLAASGAILIVYGLLYLRRRPVDRRVHSQPLGGLWVGFATLMCNSGALVMWSAVGTQLAAATRIEQVGVVVGIGSGSSAWFIGVAYLSARGKQVLGGRMQRVVQLVAGMIVAFGAMSLARAVL